MATVKFAILLVGLLVQASRAIDHETYCSFCSFCMDGKVQCHATNQLRSIPSTLPANTDSVSIYKENITQKDLRGTLFQFYPPKMTTLSIRSCGINKILFQTFVHFEEIKKLDLSHNSIMLIGDEAFKGVKIGSLMLDNNPGLAFKPTAFLDATIERLYMRNCGLMQLDFAVVQPLFGPLQLFNVSSNHLTTLESSYSYSLQNLHELGLVDNPFKCDCKIIWLIRLMRERYPSGHSLGHVAMPMCSEPMSFAGRRLNTLQDDEFYCDLPRIHALEVDLTKPKIPLLNCEVIGSPNVSTRWYRESMLLMDSRRRSAQLELSPSTGLDSEEYTCMALDMAGNVTTKLNIRWPPAQQIETAPLPVLPVARKPGTYIGALEDDVQIGFFIRKQFTVLELAGAVVGTFTLTMVLFICCFCARRTRFSKASVDSTGAVTKFHKASYQLSPSELCVDTNMPVSMNLLQQQTPSSVQKPGTMRIFSQPGGINNFFVAASSGDESTNLQMSSGERQSTASGGSSRKPPLGYNDFFNNNNNNSNHNSQYSDVNVYEAPSFQSPLPPLPVESPFGGPQQQQHPNALTGMYNPHLQQALLAAATMNRMNGVGPPVPQSPLDLNMLQQQIQINQMQMLHMANAAAVAAATNSGSDHKNN